jgi:hypothetical protein
MRPKAELLRRCAFPEIPTPWSTFKLKVYILVEKERAMQVALFQRPLMAKNAPDKLPYPFKNSFFTVID